MKYDQEEEFVVKVSGTFHVMDYSEEGAIEYIKDTLDNRIKDLSIEVSDDNDWNYILHNTCNSIDCYNLFNRSKF